MNQGRIHLYYGEGKGKTTAAIGMVARAAGNGWKVLLAQFLKGGETGEVTALRQLPGVTVLRDEAAGKFTWEMTPEELAETRKRQQKRLEEAAIMARAGQCGLLVLDEALGACGAGVLDTEALLDFVAHKPPAVELVLTGRDPDPRLVELADYVTEMKLLKHPFQQGLAARKGVEY